MGLCCFLKLFVNDFLLLVAGFLLRLGDSEFSLRILVVKKVLNVLLSFKELRLMDIKVTVDLALARFMLLLRLLDSPLDGLDLFRIVRVLGEVAGHVVFGSGSKVQ